MALDGLAVSVSSRTADVTSGIQSVKRTLSGLSREALSTGGSLRTTAGAAEEMGDEATSLSARLFGLSRSADEAGDNIAQAGRRAAVTGGLFSALSVSTDGAAISMGTLSTVTTLSLIPSLFTAAAAATALAAPLALLAGGAVALGAAFAGVIGLGVAGGFQEIKAALQEVFGEIAPFVRLLGQQFTPLILDAIHALTPLAHELFPIIISELKAMRQPLREFGTAVADILPSLVQGILDLAQMALPVFTEFIEWLQENGGDVFAGIHEAALALMPVLSDLLDAVIDFLPEFVEFGTVAASVLIPALTRLVRAGADVLSWVNSLDRRTQGLIATASFLAPVLAKVGLALLGISGPIGIVIGAIAGLALAWKENFGNIRGIVAGLWADLKQVFGNRLPTLIAEVKQLWKSLRPVLEPLFNVLATIVSTSIVVAFDALLSTVTSIVQFLNGDFTSAFESLGGLFKRVGERVAGLVKKWFGEEAFQVLKDVGGTILWLIEKLDEALQKLNKLRTQKEGPTGRVTDVGPRGGLPQTIPAQGATQPAAASGPTQVDIFVEGDKDVVKDVSADVYDQRERQRTDRIFRN